MQKMMQLQVENGETPSPWQEKGPAKNTCPSPHGRGVYQNTPKKSSANTEYEDMRVSKQNHGEYPVSRVKKGGKIHTRRKYPMGQKTTWGAGAAEVWEGKETIVNSSRSLG